jgi:hypothetical protein
MKDVVSDEAVPTKLNSYFSHFWFIFYEFRKFSEWTGDKADHTPAIPAATTDPIYQSPPKFDS